MTVQAEQPEAAESLASRRSALRKTNASRIASLFWMPFSLPLEKAFFRVASARSRTKLAHAAPSGPWPSQTAKKSAVSAQHTGLKQSDGALT